MKRFAVLVVAAAVLAVVGAGVAVAVASLPSGATYWCVKVGAPSQFYQETKGTTPHACNSGYVLFGVGPHGLQGPQGVQGSPGPAGVSGYVVAQCAVAEDGATGNFFVASSSGGTCSVTGDYKTPGQASLVCPTGDKALSWSSATSTGNGNIVAFDAMLNADATGYQYVVFSNPPNPVPASTDIEVTCAQVS